MSGDGWTRPGEEPVEPPRERREGQPGQPQYGQPQYGQPQYGAPQGWGNPGWTPPPPKPGVIPLRPLGVGEILDGAIATVRTQPRTVLTIAGVVAVVAGLTTFLLGQAFAAVLDDTDLAALEDPDAPLEQSTDALGELLAVAGVGSVLQLVLVGIATTIATGLITVAVSRAVIGQRIGLGEAWRTAAPRLPRLVAVSILHPLLYLSGFLVAGVVAAVLVAAGAGALGAVLGVLLVLAAIPLAVWLYVIFALATPAVVLEGQGVVDAFRRSARLVKGAFWRTLGLLLLVAVLVAVVSNIIAVPFGLLAEGGSFLTGDLTGSYTLRANLLNAIGSMLALLLTVPFSAAAIVLIYVDRRIRREGLDVELARAAGVAPPQRQVPGGWGA